MTNNNLSALEVKECGFGPGCVRQLSLALGDCNHSLTSVRLSQNYMGDDPDNLMDGAQLAEIIEALGVHPQLGNLELICMDIGTNECMALADLLHSTFTQLDKLDLSYMDIDDEAVEALVGGLTNSNLRVLGLSGNGITSRGCRSLAAMLEHPNSNLEELYLYDNNIGDERAPILANSLARNCKLKILDLRFSGITAEGWFGFKTVLCDTSSISSTFLSNHTLIGLGFTAYPNPLPDDVEDLLELNEGNDDKKQVAMEKILMHHPHFDIHPFFEWDMNVLPIMIEWFERAGAHFDMQPLFEWDMKMLPLAVNWFERAGSIQNIDEAEVGKRKLGVIYEFVRAMPEVFEPAPTAG